MAAFTVNHNYTSRRDGQQFGPWAKGDTVDLGQADAEWVERDSPGCLSPVKETKAKPPAADRQHRGGANR